MSRALRVSAYATEPQCWYTVTCNDHDACNVNGGSSLLPPVHSFVPRKYQPAPATNYRAMQGIQRAGCMSTMYLLHSPTSSYGYITAYILEYTCLHCFCIYKVYTEKQQRRMQEYPLSCDRISNAQSFIVSTQVCLIHILDVATMMHYQR